VNAFSRIFPTTAAPQTGGPSGARRIGPFTEKQLAIVGVAVAVGLGLYSAHRAKTNGTAGNLGDTGSSSDTLGAGAYDSSGALGTYDSTASDVYDALQPQVEAVGNATDAVNTTAAGLAGLNTTLTGLPSVLSSAIQAALPKPAKAAKPKTHKAATKGKKPKSKPKAAHPAATKSTKKPAKPKKAKKK
jgi:hypothetical protein